MKNLHANIILTLYKEMSKIIYRILIIIGLLLRNSRQDQTSNAPKLKFGFFLKRKIGAIGY